MAEIPSARPEKPFVTPPEVLAYFREKRQAPRFSWLDVFAEEHARAFTVAKAVDAELLDAFRRTLDGALERSEGFDTWKTAMEAELKRLGWDRPREVKDPQLRDRSRTVDFTRPRRLRTIFWSNMNAARAAGQWDRIQRTKRALPMLLYVRTTASDPRPEHLAWAGIILPVDHPFWRTHFPPNGWGCKCTVRQITLREAARLLEAKKGRDGIFYVDQPPDDGPPRLFTNRRTGAVAEVPAGIDPGWHTNPGLARSKAAIDQATTTLSRLTEPTPAASAAAGREVARETVAEIVASPAFEQHHASALRIRRAQKGLIKAREEAAGRRLAPAERQAAELAAADAAPFTDAAMPVAVAPERLAGFLDGRPGLAVMTDRAIGHGADRHPTAAAEFGAIQTMLDQGEIHVDTEDPNQLWAFGEVEGDRKMAKLTFDGLRRLWFVTTFFGRLRKNYRANQLARRATQKKLLDEGE